MSENVLKNVRIVHKHDIEENWLKATNFIPKQGELIIYDIDDKYNYERMKIGDGNTLVNDLSFITKDQVDYRSLLNRDFFDTPQGEIIEYGQHDSMETIFETNKTYLLQKAKGWSANVINPQTLCDTIDKKNTYYPQYNFVIYNEEARNSSILGIIRTVGQKTVTDSSCYTMIDSKNFECTGFANLNSGTLNSGWKFVFIIDNSILTEELAILYPENGLYMTCGEYSPTAWKYLYAGIVTTQDRLPDRFLNATIARKDYVDESIKEVVETLQIATDEEILEMLLEEDMLMIVTDNDGTILTDENNNILLW